MVPEEAHLRILGNERWFRFSKILQHLQIFRWPQCQGVDLARGKVTAIARDLKFAHSEIRRMEDVLAKIDAQIGENQRLEISTRIRRESDFVPEDIKLSVPGNEKDRTNDETRFDIKHEWSSGDFLNEARFGYEKYQWNPHARLSTPFVKYVVSPSNTSNSMSAACWPSTLRQACMAG